MSDELADIALALVLGFVAVVAVTFVFTFCLASAVGVTFCLAGAFVVVVEGLVEGEGVGVTVRLVADVFAGFAVVGVVAAGRALDVVVEGLAVVVVGRP